MTEQTTEPTEPVDPNVAVAQESQTDGEQLVECPTCGNPRRQFTIVDGKCDSCRSEGQRAAIVNTLGWPEVRQRRNLMIAQTDHTQLGDRTDEVQAGFAGWRQSLRDVTKESNPLAAWYKLDELEASRPKE